MNVAALDRLESNAYIRGEGRCHVVIGFERNGGHYVWRIQKMFAQDKVSVLDNVLRLQRHLVPLKWRTSESSIWAMELPDLCYFPKYSPSSGSDAIAVELKPKQGFFPMVKSRDGIYKEMYDFCPLDLYSNNFKRVYRAISCLVEKPHANMKVFRNGQLVHSSQQPAAKPNLDALFNHNCNVSRTEDFAELIAKVLTAPSVEESKHGGSETANAPLLQYILWLQKQDTKGPFDISEAIVKLQEGLKSAVCSNDWLCLLSNADASTKASAVRSLTTATLRDCSLMITMRITSCEPEKGPYHALRLSCGCSVIYHLRLIDLDIKSPRKLIAYAERLYEAAEYVRQSKIESRRPPCLEE
uniref:Inositol-pentakisphosphate 2-kinase n=1 Tax=Trichuris muris TaxID=70415 RepID=A0A5S6QLJ9_TRIMR